MATIPMSGECRKVVRTEKLRRIEVQNSEQRRHLSHKGSGGVLAMRWCSLCQYREETGGACSGGAERRQRLGPALLPESPVLLESGVRSDRQTEHSCHCFLPLSCAFVTSIDMTLQETSGRRKIKFAVPLASQRAL